MAPSFFSLYDSDDSGFKFDCLGRFGLARLLFSACKFGNLGANLVFGGYICFLLITMILYDQNLPYGNALSFLSCAGRLISLGCFNQSPRTPRNSEGRHTQGIGTTGFQEADDRIKG